MKRRNLEATKRLLTFDDSRLLLNWKDINGRTPFDLAFRTKEKAIIECLESISPASSNDSKETNPTLRDPEAEAAAALRQAMTQRIYRAVFDLGIWRVLSVAIVLTFLLHFALAASR